MKFEFPFSVVEIEPIWSFDCKYFYLHNKAAFQSTQVLVYHENNSNCSAFHMIHFSYHIMCFLNAFNLITFWISRSRLNKSFAVLFATALVLGLHSKMKFTVLKFLAIFLIASSRRVGFTQFFWQFYLILFLFLSAYKLTLWTQDGCHFFRLSRVTLSISTFNIES